MEVVHVRDVADRADHIAGAMFLHGPFVYIGRFQFWGAGRHFAASIWHNPFSAKRYGREEALRLFEDYARTNPRLMARVPELRGKVLACWCAPLACHGDVLLRLIAETCGEVEVFEAVPCRRCNAGVSR